MGEGTHTPSVIPQVDTPENKTTNNKPRSNQWKYLIAGTAGALLIAGTAFQVYRTRGANADTGRAKLGSSTATAPKNLARVGDSLITYDAVAKEAMARHAQPILDKMINRLIILNACREKRITITQAEVDSEVLKIAKQFNLDPANWYQMLAAERNLSKLQYQRDIIWPMLALKKLAGADVKVTREDLKNTFERDYGERVKIRMIMMDNHRKLQEVWNDAVRTQKTDPGKTLAKFKQLAQTHSIEPTSRTMGGQVPPVRRHAGGRNIEKAAFELNAGEISSIIQVGKTGTARYVILYCEGRTTPAVSDINEVRDLLIAQIKEEKMQESVAKTFEKLKKETPVQNFMLGTTAGGVRQTSFNVGTKTSPVTQPRYTRPQRTTSRN